MIVQEPVQAAIWHCLNHYAYQDATFLAERLCSEVESDESLFTLATCYYRSNQIHQAYWILNTRGATSPHCRFLLAKCAFELKKYGTVEWALVNENFIEIKHLDEVVKNFGEIGCFALQLIARVCSQTERHEIAAEANRRALKLNPFLWQSFADLCNRGQKVDAHSIFEFTSTDTFATCQGHSSVISFSNQNCSTLFGGYGGNGVGIVGDQILFSGDLPIGINYNFHTPVGNGGGGGGGDHHNHHYQNSSVITPINLMSPIAGGGLRTTGLNVNNNNNNNNSSLMIDDPSMLNSTIDTSYDRLNPNTTIDTQSATPFRNKQFKYLSAAISPSTPSFGVLPITTSPSEASTIMYTTPTIQQPTQTLAEVNDQKPGTGKKIKGYVGSVLRKDSPLQLSKPIFSQTGNITPRTQSTSNTLSTAAVTAQNVRRSSRLSFSNYSVKENAKNPSINKFVAPRSPPRKTKQRISKMNITNAALNELNNEKQQQLLLKTDKEKIETVTSAAENKVLFNNNINQAQTIIQQVLNLKKQSADGLMNLLRSIGQGYWHLCQYNTKKAIETFSSLPQQHFFSSWVQSMIAKAQYEQCSYESAAKIFQEIHKKEPHRLQLMEIYSTVLWHLQREVTLSALAQDLMTQDKLSPITWCVAGNCFSLHKEHETAIKFFERAVQVDPEYAYSYTLLGHELVITEELEKAMSCFRTAVLKDSRHYNAWFGIGTIYSKQERYNLAEIHYNQALRITPRNSVIMVHIGAMQFYLKKSDQAMQTLNMAIQLDPKNPLCKFHRGSMYFQMGRDQEALRELEELKQILPTESVVYYLIGKIHKKLGNVDLALMHFSWATDLDPKGANNQIKDAFDANISHGATGGGSITANSILEPDFDPISERSNDSTQIRNNGGGSDGEQGDGRSGVDNSNADNAGAGGSGSGVVTANDADDSDGFNYDGY